MQLHILYIPVSPPFCFLTQRYQASQAAGRRQSIWHRLWVFVGVSAELDQIVDNYLRFDLSGRGIYLNMQN